jgi:hypothetical protein
MDENKQNNKLDNLCWVTRSENMDWNGLQQKIKRTGPKDINKWVSFISEFNSKKIIGINILNNTKLEFKSIAMAKRAGFNAGNISACCKGKRKKHKGYTWSYKETPKQNANGVTETKLPNTANI